MPEAAVQETNLQSATPEISSSPLIPPPPPQSQAIIPAKPRQDSLVLDHWYALVPDFTMSSHEFYAAIEKDLTKRQVPGMAMSRVVYGEGGILSDQREYLRFTRERLAFDICAAPFGTSFFFSCRFSEFTPKITTLQVIILMVTVTASWFAFDNWLGRVHGTAIFAIGLIGFYMVCSLAPAVKNLDASLLNSPIFGGIYLRFFRKETYYREDARLMYLETVNAITKEVVQHVSGAKGIDLITFKERSPILSELYKTKSVSLPKQPAPA